MDVKEIIYEPTTHKNTHSKMRETTLVNNCVNCIIKLKNDPEVLSFSIFILLSWENSREKKFFIDIKSRLAVVHSVILDGRGATSLILIMEKSAMEIYILIL